MDPFHQLPWVILTLLFIRTFDDSLFPSPFSLFILCKLGFRATFTLVRHTSRTKKFCFSELSEFSASFSFYYFASMGRDNLFGQRPREADDL